METPKYIVGIGEILWDISSKGKNLGGAPANFAYHANTISHIIGASTHGMTISAVGMDDDGVEIIDNLLKRSMGHSIARGPFETGKVLVSHDEKGEPSYEIVENVAWDYIPFNDDLRIIAANTQVVCFGSLAQRSNTSRESIHKFLTCTSDNCLKVFDINLRQDSKHSIKSPMETMGQLTIIEESLMACDILKINKHELLILNGIIGDGKLILEQDNEEKIARFCREIIRFFNLKMIILTCDKDGSYIYYSDNGSDATSFIKTPHVDVVDTVGAGDSFAGSFCACYAAGCPIPKAHQIAVEVSAFVCQHAGAMPDLKPIEETVKSIYNK